MWFSILDIIMDNTAPEKHFFRKEFGYKVKYKSNSEERIKLYVGEFIEDAEGGMYKSKGALLFVDRELVERFKGLKVLETLLNELNASELKRLAESRADLEKFLQTLIEIVENSEIIDKEDSVEYYQKFPDTKQRF